MIAAALLQVQTAYAGELHQKNGGRLVDESRLFSTSARCEVSQSYDSTSLQLYCALLTGADASPNQTSATRLRTLLPFVVRVFANNATGVQIAAEFVADVDDLMAHHPQDSLKNAVSNAFYTRFCDYKHSNTGYPLYRMQEVQKQRAHHGITQTLHQVIFRSAGKFSSAEGYSQIDVMAQAIGSMLAQGRFDCTPASFLEDDKANVHTAFIKMQMARDYEFLGLLGSNQLAQHLTYGSQCRNWLSTSAQATFQSCSSTLR